MTMGNFFTPQDVTTAAKVAVLGSTVRDQLFGPDADPIGQTIRIGNSTANGQTSYPFTVAGVMMSKGQSGVGQDQDDVVFVPYTTVMKKMRGITFIQQVTVSAPSADDTSRDGRPHHARCCACATRSSPATPTTSWSARWRKWRPCASRPRRR